MTIDYVYFSSNGEKIVNGVRSDRIYKVINHGGDWFLIKVKGKSVYVDRSYCRISSFDEFKKQDRHVEKDEVFDGLANLENW